MRDSRAGTRPGRPATRRLPDPSPPHTDTWGLQTGSQGSPRPFPHPQASPASPRWVKAGAAGTVPPRHGQPSRVGGEAPLYKQNPPRFKTPAPNAESAAITQLVGFNPKPPPRAGRRFSPGRWGRSGSRRHGTPRGSSLPHSPGRRLGWQRPSLKSRSETVSAGPSPRSTQARSLAGHSASPSTLGTVLS